jgi:hypothetical protein
VRVQVHVRLRVRVRVRVHVHVRVRVCVCVRVYKCRNAGLSGIRSVRYRTEKKLTMPGIVRYRTKPRQSGIFLVRYQTEIIPLFFLCSKEHFSIFFVQYLGVIFDYY